MTQYRDFDGVIPLSFEAQAPEEFQASLVNQARRDYERAKLDLRLFHTPKSRIPAPDCPKAWRRDRDILKRRVHSAAAELDRLEEAGE